MTDKKLGLRQYQISFKKNARQSNMIIAIMIILIIIYDLAKWFRVLFEL